MEARMTRRLLSLTLLALFAVACDDAATSPDADVAPDAASEAMFKRNKALTEMDQSPIYRDFSAWNARLREEGLDLQLVKYEYVTAPSAAKAGRLVLANDRSKQLPFDWVPGDSRRTGLTNLFWAIDGTEGETSTGLSQADTDGATVRAMQTWQDVNCSNIPLTALGSTPIDVGIMQDFFGFGGSPTAIAGDYVQAGWLPPAFFEALEAGGGSGILGVTFTFGCVDAGGNPTDIDGNGKLDTCYSETYYNDNPVFAWAIDAPENPFGPVDVETVILHESGHGLSQGHFGAIFFDGSGKASLGGKFGITHLHFSPYSVMKAAIWATQQELTGSDVAGHCSIWGSWPNK
jgi:hypothetical protein